MAECKYKANVTIVGGCGHVGLPLGLVLAENGYHITLFDVNKSACEMINNGILPFAEEYGEELLQKHRQKNLQASSDPKTITTASIVIFTLGTPVDEHHNPQISNLVNGIWDYIDYLQPNQLLVLRSTLYPGTSEFLVDKFIRHFGSVKLAFCPERIVQGKGIVEICKLPQIISGNNEVAEQEATELFGEIAASIVKLSLKEAEVGKLFTNSWRYLEFAIANQFYMLAEDNGVDFYRVFDAITQDYPRAASFAKAGLTAGPCLFKDTMQLAAFSNNNFFLGHAAMLVNEGLANHLVMEMRNKLSGDLQGKTIAILGMTFKANNDDIRESLSFKIKKLLEFQGANVIISDPYLPETTPLEEALDGADGIILGCTHNNYKDLKVECPFVDCWGFWRS